jgi:hypothetical protein
MEISEKLSVNYQKAYYLAKRYGVLLKSNRKIYPRNSHYFDIIDSDRKAYWLGLLYADGNIHRRVKKMRLKLIEPDKYLLEAMSKDIEYQGPLYFSKASDIGNHDLWSLEIADVHMVESLYEIGLYPNKSLTVEFPSLRHLSDDLFWPFIRGYFDGDGTICMDKNDRHHLVVQICVSEAFGRELKNKLEEKTGVHVTLFATKKSIYKVSIKGFRQCLFFLDKIYESATIRMERKHLKYIDIRDRRIRDGFIIPDTKELPPVVSNLTRDSKTGKFVGPRQLSA